MTATITQLNTATATKAPAKKTATKRTPSTNTKKAPAKRTTSRRKPKSAADMSVIEQIITTFSRDNRLAAVIGTILGGLVPFLVFVVTHYEIDLVTWNNSMIPLAILSLGGLLFSAKTVYEWTAKAFHNRAKAAGFVVLVEGTMVLSSVEWLSITALVVLVAINAIATGCTLALQSR